MEDRTRRRQKEREGKRNLCLRVVNGNGSPYYPHLWKLLKWEVRKKNRGGENIKGGRKREGKGEKSVFKQ